MKSSKGLSGLAVMSFVIAMCAFGSKAVDPRSFGIGGTYGRYWVDQCPAGSSRNNPNLFPVISVYFDGQDSQAPWHWAFLLDGSEYAKNMAKILQDGALNHTVLFIYVDNTITYDTECLAGLGGIPCGKLVGIQIISNLN
jgi:hypothetical protein